MSRVGESNRDDASDGLDLVRFPSLAAAARYSHELRSRLNRDLAPWLESTPIVTVAVSGSIGRGEAVPGADADLLIVLASSAVENAPATKAAVEKALLIAAEITGAETNPRGIYRRPVVVDRILDPSTRGVVAEDMRDFGQRIQILLDATPVLRRDAFNSLRARILARYCAPDDPVFAGSYLVDDVIRYYRSLNVEVRFHRSPRTGSWRMRDLKQRFSRRLMVAGLLACLAPPRGRGGAATDFVQRIDARLDATPLDRLSRAMIEAGQEARLERVFSLYDRYLEVRLDPDRRAALLDPAAAEGERIHASLLGDSRSLGRELIEFFIESDREKVGFAEVLWW